VVSDSEDIANVRLSFENGAVANLTASRISAKDMRKMRLFQKHAYVSIDFLLRESEILSLKDGSDTACNEQRIQMSTIGIGEHQKNLILEKPTPPEVNSLQSELEGFVQAIHNNTPVLVSGEEGFRALEVALIIRDQIQRPHLG
jgi:predicted dehydrogenase